MKRCLSLLMMLAGLAALPALAQGETDSALLLVTGAYYDESGQVMVTARPARVELPQGAPQEQYRLVEEAEQTFSLMPDAYLSVPQSIPIAQVDLAQAATADFPIYLNDFMRSLSNASFSAAPPEKGDGIGYTQYSLLYRAAVSGNSILSLTYFDIK